MGLAQKLFGTHSEHELKRIYPIADKIEGYRESYSKLSDEELKGKTKEFKDRLAKGETLDDILPEAFATVREAGRRVLGMEHYRVQLIGGIILHQGRIAEMKTGEGKTLVCTLPAYLNALTEEGVIVVTVNDYLAKRDAEQMGMIHEFLGLKVGVVLHDSTREERQAAYGSDITYVTNNELGFDYLRDNMAIYKSELVLRNLKYCIIDEVDSVLIDEARTPLIISGQSGKSTKLYELCDILARQLQRGEYKGERTKMQAIMNEEVEEDGDFIVNEKDKVVNLTEQGIHKVEQFFHIDNYADPENLEIQHNVTLALRAHNLMFRDKDYVVKDDEVLILNRFLKEDPSKELSTVATCEDIVAMKEDVKNVYVHPVLIDYIVELARMTRQQDNVSIGVSPRGTLGMLNAARAYAYVAGRDYVVPEDIKILAPVVWAHRIVLQTGYMNMDNKEQIIEHVVNNTAVPTEDWKR